MGMNSKVIFSLMISVSLSGCGAIYTNVRVPRAYRSATPGEVHSDKNDRLVSGQACSTSLLFLFAWGDAGYAAAAKDALKEEPASILYDVKADAQIKSAALGLYTRACTIVTGKIAKP